MVLRRNDVSTVYIIDDDADVRKMTSWLVQELGYSNYPFASATDFLDALPHLKPGCMLVDLYMPDMSGIALIRATAPVRDAFPAILISGYSEVDNAVEAMQAGALDVLRKPLALARLETALARVNEKLAPPDPPSIDDIIPGIAQAHGLTERQMQVLRGLAAGQSNKAIGSDLTISTRTVEMHRAAVMTKLGVNSLPALLRLLLAATVAAPKPQLALDRASG